MREGWRKANGWRGRVTSKDRGMPGGRSLGRQGSPMKRALPSLGGGPRTERRWTSLPVGSVPHRRKDSVSWMLSSKRGGEQEGKGTGGRRGDLVLKCYTTAASSGRIH